MHACLINTFLQVPLNNRPENQSQLTPQLETLGPQMAQNTPAPGQDDRAQAFFEAFQVYTSGIIDHLPSDQVETAKAAAVENLVPQLNSDYRRLIFITRTIQARVKRDVVWVDCAIAMYDGLAASIHPFLSAPGLAANQRGPLLVQHYLIQSVQADFDKTMGEVLWNVGQIHFMGRLGASRGSIGALTVHVIFHILGRMMLSDWLFEGENLGLCMDYIVYVGPFLDSEASGAKKAFTEMLMQMRDRVKGLGGRVDNMAMLWVLKLREDGWKAQQGE